MRTRPAVVLFSLAAICAWAPNSNSAFSRDLLGQPGGVQVAVAATPADTWKAATVGAKIDLVQTNTGQTLGKRVPSRVTILGTVAGSVASAFETDLAPNVVRIEPITLSFEVVEQPGAQPGVLTFIPGRLRPVDVTFTFMRPTPTMSEWVKTTLAGTISRRDVNIKIKSAQGLALRAITLLRCLPSAYTSSGTMSVISIRPEAIQIKAMSHVTMFDWAATYLAGNPSRRSLSVAFTDGSGHTTSTPMLKDAVLGEISWSALDATGTELVNESVSVQPTQIDPIP
jgi:hypothetical protein